MTASQCENKSSIREICILKETFEINDARWVPSLKDIVGSTLIQNVAKIECRCVSCSKTPSYPQLPNGYVNWIIVVYADSVYIRT